MLDPVAKHVPDAGL